MDKLKRLKSILLPVLILVLMISGMPVFSQEKPVESITIQELRDHMYYLASDELGGRVTGTKGYNDAVKYCAIEFGKANLGTLFKDSDGEGTYLQPVSFSRRSRNRDNNEATELNTWNVVAIVEGTDPKLKSEYITVGAHLDHVGPRGGKVCNGADDNASGSVGVIEVAEAIAMSPPKRSVIFILYAGEEMGLQGSRYFLENPPVPIDKIVANINLDMIGRTGNGLDAETKEHFLRYSSKVSPKFKDFVKKVNRKTIKQPLIYAEDGTSPGGVGGSDHMSFLRKDIPAIMFFSGVHKDLHQPGDDPEKIEYDKMQKISQLVFELAYELGNISKIF